MKKIISVQFKDTGKKYYFDPGADQYNTGDFVIVETSRGTECGKVVQGVHELPACRIPKTLKPVMRLADDADVHRMEQNRNDEADAFEIGEERILAHNLPMKLIDVEYTFTRNKILFYFTADGRVDFRELVKDLAGIFRTRIELWQIGVRDEAKMTGGMGICGQEFCCSRFMQSFEPVSIKMAKEQNLSLNPSKISGNCGRLMCCLAFEEPAYDYLNKVTPDIGSTVKTPDGVGVVTEVNLISGMLKVKMEQEEVAQNYYKRTDCEYIRGGKRPPIKPDPAYEQLNANGEESDDEPLH